MNGITAPTNAYTMEAWVKPRDGADMMVVSHGGGGQLFIKDGNLAFRQVQDTIYSNGAVLPGVWTHVAATWDGHNTRLYVNGVQVAHSTTDNKPPSGTSTFYVGYGEIRPWFKGSLDEVAYYAKALTPNRILEHFLADPPPPLETFGDEPVVSPPDPGDPGDPGTEPGDPGTEPGPGTGTGDDPGTGDPVADDPRIQESGSPKATGNKKLKGGKAAISKCKKIKNKKKRASCLKKARK